MNFTGFHLDGYKILWRYSTKKKWLFWASILWSITNRLSEIPKDVNKTILLSYFKASSNACIPSEALALRVLQTFLYCVKPSVKTLSLRFNTFPPEAQDYLIDWVSQNDCIFIKLTKILLIFLKYRVLHIRFHILEGIEILYIQGTNFDDKRKAALKAACKKCFFSDLLN